MRCLGSRESLGFIEFTGVYRAYRVYRVVYRVYRAQRV